MLLRGFRLFGVALHREPKGTKRSMAVVWEELAFLGDTRSRHELLVFAQATREAPTVSPKSLLISGAKNEPSGHGEVLLLK